MAADIEVDKRIRQAGLPLMEIQRAVAVRKEEQELFAHLDRAVRTYTSGEQFGATYTRWHTQPEKFWTKLRLLRYGGLLFTPMLISGLSVMLWWRQRSIVNLQRQLQELQAQLATATGRPAAAKKLIMKCREVEYRVASSRSQKEEDERRCEPLCVE